MYLVVNNGGQAEVVKDLGAVPPHVDGAILSLTLIIEPVNL